MCIRDRFTYPMPASGSGTMPGDGSLIIVMRSDATREDVDRVLARLAEVDAEAHVSEGSQRTIIGIVGDRTLIQQLPWEALPGVERAVPVLSLIHISEPTRPY